MWFNKGAADAFATLAARDAVVTELRVQIARLTAHCDWLMAHVNELKLERAELYQRLGLYVPVPTITPGGQPVVPDSGAGLPGAKPYDVGDLLTKAREIRTEQQHERVARADGNVPFADALASELDIFSDMGDAAAEKAGIKRTPEGELV